MNFTRQNFTFAAIFPKRSFARGKETIVSRIFTWSKLLNTPFWALFSLLPVVIYQELGGSSFEVALLVALRPLTSLLAPYWSAMIAQRTDRIRANILWARGLGLAPFLFAPFWESSWTFLFAAGCYMVLLRGATPAWIELLKHTLQSQQRSHLFAWASLLTYLCDGLFALLVGWWLDAFPGSVRLLFPLTATTALLALPLQWRLPRTLIEENKILHEEYPLTIEKEKYQEKPLVSGKSKKKGALRLLLVPWSEAFDLLRERPDFLRFQIGFMLGGGGLMVIHGALPLFYVNSLSLSYAEVALAIGLYKGVGFAVASPFWARSFPKCSLFRFCGVTTLLCGLFALLLLMASEQTHWPLYTAYLVYGAMQAGSEMGWNLSAPRFSPKGDSSRFTSVSLLLGGLRGAIAPFLGSWLAVQLFPEGALIVGFFLFMVASLTLFRRAESREAQSREPLDTGITV